jgi:parallel beta-helix repeat protein
MSNQGRFRHQVFISLAVLATCVAVSEFNVTAAHGLTPVRIAQAPISATVFYVNPIGGVDAPTSGKAEAAPFKTITYALQQVKPNIPTTIRLAQGTYSKDSGEVFPLTLKPGLILVGDEASQGKTTIVIGGGNYLSPTWAGQNVAILGANNSEIRGISVTNPNKRGTGVWVESTNPTIANNSFVNSLREGVFITGTANPLVAGNYFGKNNGNGVVIEKSSTGTIKGNIFQENGFGIAIGGTSSPLIEGNQVVQNISGIYLNSSARPTLRSNTITDNQENGVVITVTSQPDLGTEASPGGNLIRRNNLKKVKDAFDVSNITKNVVSAIGNDIDPKTISGPVTFVAVTAPIVEPPKVEPPKVDPPKVDPPKVDPPKVDPPKVDPPKVDPPVTPGAFKDVPANFWAKGFIDGLAAQGVISGSGDGTFKPNAPITRAEFAAIINKAFAPAPINPAKEFSDVSKTKWYYDAIQTASRGGYMAGYENNIFKPELNIPRVQIVVAIANGVGYGKTTADLTLLNRFSDGTGIPNYAKNAVAAATARKIIVNHPELGKLQPNQEATRAEVAAFIYQALVDLGRIKTPIQSPYIVTP